MVYRMMMLAIEELEGGTYTIDTILSVINQLTVWAIKIGIALSGISAVIGFISIAVLDYERKQRAKQALIMTVVGIFGIVFSISLVNIILRMFA